MLIDFAITNYKSIKKTVHLNMVYSTGESNEQQDEKYNKTNYIDFMKAYAGTEEGWINVCPVIALFGANASGKSNILKAFLTMRFIVLHGSVENLYTPFMFSDSTEKAPTKFEITFSTDSNDDPRIYSYGIEYTAHQIEREYLKQIGKEEDKTIYDTNDFDFNTIPMKLWQEFITRRNPIANILLDARCKYFNDLKEETQKALLDVRDFFEKLFIADDINLAPISVDNAKTVKDWLLRMDMRFSDIEIKVEEHSEEFEFKYDKEKIPEGQTDFLPIYPTDIDGQKKELQERYKNHLITFVFNNQAPIFNAYEINMVYPKDTKDNTDKTVELNYVKAESTGTKNLFRFLFVLLDALQHGKIIVFDEIDRTIHTELLKFLFGIMHARNLNKNAQMICSSHNPCIISSVGRHGTMFVEKGADLSTEVSFLSEYKYYSTDVLDDYLNDRFGAIPRVVDVFENMEVPNADK